MATPVDFEDKEPIELVVNRAVNGTIGILKACLNSKTVQRVVYTSSASAVVFNDTGAETMDEGFWSDLEVVKAMKVKHGKSYFLSKTLTEKAALEFAERHGLDLVTVVPTFVVGPFICSKFPSSVRDTLPMLLGMCSAVILVLRKTCDNQTMNKLKFPKSSRPNLIFFFFFFG